MSARSSAATYTLDAGSTAFDTGEFSDAVKMDNSNIGGAFFTITTNAAQTSPTWNDASLDWTIEFWYKRNTTGVDSFERDIVLSGPLTIVIDGNFSAGSRFRISAVGGMTYNTSIPTGYTHIAVVCDSGNQSLYYNGTRVATGSTASGGGDTTIQFGHEYSGGLQHISFFDEVRFSQVARYSGASISVPTAAFLNDNDTVALFHFNNTTTDDTSPLGSAALTASTDLSAKASQTITLFSDIIQDHTWDTVPNDQWDSFSKDNWTWRGVWLQNEATSSVSAGLAIFANTLLESSTDLDIAADILKIAQSDLSAEFAVSASVQRVISGTANLESTAAVSASAQRLINAVSGLEAVFTQTVSAGILPPLSADLSASTALSASAQRLISISSDLASVSDISVQGSRQQNLQADLTATATLTATALNLDQAVSLQFGLFTQSVSAGIIHQISADLTDALAFEITAINYRNGQAQLTSTSTLTASASLIPSVIIDPLISSSDLICAADLFVGGRADLEAFVATITAGEKLLGGTADLEAQFTVTARGSNLISGSSQLQAFVATITDGRISNVTASADLSAIFHGVFEGDLRLLSSDFVIPVLSETRKYSVDTETRLQPVLRENRILTI